ncbi:MAG: AMP-binding protein [Bacillota bacterium]|nr:AMP-binding protein [Bacillota bacterium]
MSEELLRITLGDMLDHIAVTYPDNDGVIYTDRDYRKSYAAFRDECDIVARGLMALGIQRGDKVAIWATNHQQWLINMFATAKIGAIMVTVNTSYKIFELEYLLRQSDSMTLIMMDKYRDIDYVEIINQLNPALSASKPGESKFRQFPYLKNLIYIGAGETPPGMFGWNELYRLAEQISPEQLRERQRSLDPDDVINMQYTSGTTGYPKGVMLTHYNLVNNGKAIGDCMNFGPNDRLCIPVPFFHCFGMVLAIMASLTHATAMIPIEQFNALAVMQAIQSERCTAVHGVPTMFISMLEHPQFSEFDFSSLRTGIMAGSPCPVKVMQQVVEQMNMREITIVYGQTEASPGCTQTRVHDPLERRVNTVGRVLPGVEAKIVDPETGEELPVNTPGEFLARGYNVMRGYYKMPEATALAIDADGWLHTGDLASVDEQGYYKITGRIKDMIIRGGENIYPKEIEEFLYTHEKVSDVQVVAIPSRKYGEEVMAFVILKEGETADEQELKDFCLSSLARHKCPKYIRFIDAFPMTASGKIQKFKLKEMAIEDLNLHEENSIVTA